MIQFTEKDLVYMQKRGNDPDKVKSQFQYFHTGFDFANLQKAATVGDGIIRFTEEKKRSLLDQYDQLIAGKTICKFVPASGAASRMFKDLVNLHTATDAASQKKATVFIHSLRQYALYDDLETAMQNLGYSLSDEIEQNNYPLIIGTLLYDKGLNYTFLPKALLAFHRYAHGLRTPFEEHLVEGAMYAQGSDGICHIHFTISEQHEPYFRELLQKIREHYEERFHVKYDVTFSQQLSSGDTLAATTDNQPFRDTEGNLIFRPAGHGALIENLAKIKADLIFIKNIDNVRYEDELEDTISYKKILAAHLLTLQKQLFQYVELLSSHEEISNEQLTEIKYFAENELQLSFPHKQETQAILLQYLNRPIRVCGMVKNEGEPGGGPFLVKNENGEISWQIIESAQINLADESQKSVFQQSTHFNPVDLVCSFRQYNGDYFNLDEFVDEHTGFISSKSFEGQTLRAMELPGLWNGAMAKWITIFVEVPLSTFHPIKTIYDLEAK